MELAHKLLASKKGTAAIAAAVALLAAALIGAYVSHIRAAVSQAGIPAVVLVSKAAIAKGTPASLIAGNNLYAVAQVRHDQLQTGALVSPADIQGKTTTRDILKGEQLTAADFTAAPNNLSAKLTGNERAVALNLDSQHGLTDQITSGDHVDVYAGFNLQAGNGQAHPVLKLISQNVLILQVGHGAASGGNGSSNVILEARNGREAAYFAFTSDNGKLWLMLRPAATATAQTPGRVDAQTILFGVAPVQGVGK